MDTRTFSSVDIGFHIWTILWTPYVRFVSSCLLRNIDRGSYQMAHTHTSSIEARKLEHDHPPAPSQRMKQCQHASSYVHDATFRSLLCINLYIYIYIHSPSTRPVVRAALAAPPSHCRARGSSGGERYTR